MLKLYSTRLSEYTQLLVNSLITGSIYALVSAGLAVTFGLQRILNFAHGHLMMVGAYLFYHFYVELECGMTTSAALTFVSMAGLAFFIQKLFILPFSNSNLLLPFVTTLALATILESVIALPKVFGVNVKSLVVNFELNTYDLGDVYITPIQIIIIFSSIIILTLLALLVHATPFGRKLRSITSNPEAAEALGINRYFYNYVAFAGATILAAFAGVMIGFETNLQPTMGNAYTLKAFASMILGGLGNIWGTIAGAYLLGLIENFSVGADFFGYSLPSGYKDAFAFIIILLVLLFKPQGLFGKRERVT
jgi:branched-chain amino acid transport system permease protein